MTIAGPPLAAPIRRLLADEVHDVLARAILDGTFMPGERLNDDELITWLQVSRTPIRTALERLATAGYVELRANRYTRVGRPSRDDVRLTDDVVRATLRWATTRALENAAESQVEEFARALASADRIVQRAGSRPLSAVGLSVVYRAVGYFAVRSSNEMMRVAIDDATWRLLFGLRVLEARIPTDAWAAFRDEAGRAAVDRDAARFSAAADALHAAVLGDAV
ncbi:GntR family transcriptional regulator [Frigoribacterium sp. 2-23]|uniref:GntR family transcriptional regulator n=1 Tax=Frigoribacterium sp. 2-23 TaxID=3415006 RepID=UPI003C6F7A74